LVEEAVEAVEVKADEVAVDAKSVNVVAINRQLLLLTTCLKRSLS